MGSNFVRNALAWLEDKRRIYYDERCRVWTSSPFVPMPPRGKNGS